MLREFKDFVTRGNVLDLAIAVVIGAAFGKIVSSVVTDILMPPIGLAMGGVDFSNLFVDLSGRSHASLAEAKAAGAATINYGVFLNTLIEFLIIAFVLFVIVKQLNRLRRQPPPAEPTEKVCPFCVSTIPLKAVRCAHCTSALP